MLRVCLCLLLSFFKVFEVGSPISISLSYFSLLSVLSTSRDNRDFPVFSATTLFALLCGQVQTAGCVVHG